MLTPERGSQIRQIRLPSPIRLPCSTAQRHVASFASGAVEFANPYSTPEIDCPEPCRVHLVPFPKVRATSTITVGI